MNTVLYPLEGVKRTVYLKSIIKNPQIIVGDYTYYDDPENIYNFEKNVLYLFDFIGDKLIIGKFCQIATGVRFIMNGGNHDITNISTYPFSVFHKEWSKTLPKIISKGDTTIGNDVWIGYGATIMPGITIGHGAIIGAQSVVTKNVKPYTIVAGNPSVEIRQRFDQDIINFLLELAWWNWDSEKLALYADLIINSNFIELKKIFHEFL